ncbi:hypothetical protein CCHR01_04864 [Colletotrichum chrysophilum]|uniref:Uncharacterized protein n=1 Tax=Colletotrichum chrysophilum TaxID=1836956 RepID=A0AAD9ASA3_9PEZI|nr:hypothetical protein CCHR01_04864 [Colletotrichum chrysophilum]
MSKIFHHALACALLTGLDPRLAVVNTPREEETVACTYEGSAPTIVWLYCDNLHIPGAEFSGHCALPLVFGGFREVPRLDFVLGHDLDLDAPRQRTLEDETSWPSHSQSHLTSTDIESSLHRTNPLIPPPGATVAAAHAVVR